MGGGALGRAVAGAVLGVAMAALGCGQAAAAPGCHDEWPVVAHHAGGVIVPLAESELPQACAVQTGYASSESTVAAAPGGAIFYSPAHTENSLGRSTDGGASWSLTYPPQMEYTSLWNTVDPFVAVDRRTGRTFWVHVTGPTRTEPGVVDEPENEIGGLSTAIAFAYGFQVYSTPDDGRTWTTANYRFEPMTDWEKIFVGPARPASSGAPQPMGYPGVVYVCANSPAEVSGPGRLCYRSLDGGATFGLAGYVYPSPSAPDACTALSSNVGVVANDGTVYTPMTCANGAYLAVSTDEGSTYTWRQIAGAPGGVSVGGGVQVAIDQADNLYAMWLADDKVWVAISRDGAKTWGAPLAVSQAGLHGLALPAIAAGPRGRVGVTYYAGREASATALSAYITQTEDALAPSPLFYSGALNDPAKPIFTNYGFNASPRADYVGATYDASGALLAGVVKQLGPMKDGQVATTGYLGRLAFNPNGSPREGPLGPAHPVACQSRAGFAAVSARARGRAVGLIFRRRVERPVTVDVLQVSSARRIVPALRVAHFVSRRGPIEWDGRDAHGRLVADGYYSVRYRIRAQGATETRRVGLRRRGGRFAVLAPYERPSGCGPLAAYRLSGPVFGGSTRRALVVSYRVNVAAKVSVVVRRGRRVVRRFRARSARPGKTYRLRFTGRPGRGTYRFGLRVARRDGATRLATSLTAHRL